MKVIIVGAGEVGFHLAELLSNEKHSVTLIEKSAAKEHAARAKLNALVVRGSGANAEILDEAGIDEADLFIAVTDQDEVNLVSCLIAHESGCRRIVARIKSLDYTTSEWLKGAEKLGINLLVNPQSVVAEDVYRIVSFPGANEVVEFAAGRVVFLGYRVGKGSTVSGVSLMELAELRGMYRLVVTAIARGHDTIIPRGEDRIREGDIVYFVCNRRDVPAINYLFGVQATETKTLFVLGGERVGEAFVRRLRGLGLRIKIIERDPELCRRLSEELDDVQVLNAVGTDVATLRDEGIAGCDDFVATTPDEQANILCSVLAKNYGAKRAIAIVDRNEFVTLAPSLGVDACVSPRLATTNAILRYVRPKGIASLATVEHTNSEVFESVIPANSPLLKRPLKDLDVPRGAILGVVVRGEKVLIPGGADHLEPGDHVIVFALPEVVARVEKYFS